MKCIGEDELVRAEMGELTLNRAREVDAHVAGCSRCGKARDEIRELIADLGRRPAPADEQRFTEQVMAARSSLPVPARPRRFAIPAFAAAAVMVLAVGVATMSVSLRGKDETWTARGQATEARSRTPSGPSRSTSRTGRRATHSLACCCASCATASWIFSSGRFVCTPRALSIVKSMRRAVASGSMTR